MRPAQRGRVRRGAPCSRDGRMRSQKGRGARITQSDECARDRYVGSLAPSRLRVPGDGRRPSEPPAATSTGAAHKWRACVPEYAPWDAGPLREPRTDGLEVRKGLLLPQLLQLAASDGVTLIALTADRGGRSPFARSHEAGRARNLVGTSLRPLTTSGKSGSAGAQSSGLGAHLVTLPQNIWPGGHFVSALQTTLAPRPGLEPGTCGLTVRRSTD